MHNSITERETVTQSSWDERSHRVFGAADTGHFGPPEPPNGVSQLGPNRAFPGPPPAAFVENKDASRRCGVTAFSGDALANANETEQITREEAPR